MLYLVNPFPDFCLSISFLEKFSSKSGKCKNLRFVPEIFKNN